MSTYLYRYNDAEGGTVEMQQSMKDAPFVHIDGRPVSRIVTGGQGFTLLGGGWSGKSSPHERDVPDDAGGSESAWVNKQMDRPTGFINISK